MCHPGFDVRSVVVLCYQLKVAPERRFVLLSGRHLDFNELINIEMIPVSVFQYLIALSMV